MEKKYRIERLSYLRKAVIASATITREKNIIHNISEIDISKPRKILKEYKEKNANGLSFTAYITKCFSNTIQKFTRFNSFISGGKIVFLENLNISILVERNINGELIPEPLIVENCDKKSVEIIHTEIRKAQNNLKNENNLGDLSGNKWFKLIPSFLFRIFVKLADKNIKMGVKYGKLAITSVGMYSKHPIWVIPHGSATVLLSIGSIIQKVVLNDGQFESREHLCLTVSFDHAIIDGSPAARFMNDLIEEIQSGNFLNVINK